MSSTFGGLEMGKSALNAFRLGMQTVGHNISNMNTDGYSRQRIIFSTVTPEDIAHVGQLGQGMYASTIERIRDEFLDFQFRDNQATLGYWEKINDLYDSIQNYIAEPQSTGLRSAMDTFFTNMQTLQKSPEDTSARTALVESANSIGGMLSNLIYNFNTYNESVNMEIQQSVAEANQMLHDLAALNKEINEAEALDQNANDLYDKRDLILDKISKMMDIQYNEPLERDGVKGEFFLSVNGRVLVQGVHVRELKAHAFMWDNQVYYDVQVAENEFDIVDNINVAEALAAGPEGTYQLTVDRIANGVEWTTGGGNAHCLEVKAAVTSEFDTKITAGGGNAGLLPFVELETSKFPDGIILNKDSEDGPHALSFAMTDSSGTASTLDINIRRTQTVEIQTARLKNTITDVSNVNILDRYSGDGPYTLSFTTSSGTSDITIQRTADGEGWDLTDGTNSTTVDSKNLDINSLASFLNGLGAGFTATVKSETSGAATFKTIDFKVTDYPIDAATSVLSISDPDNLLGTLTEKKYWELEDVTNSTKSIISDEDLTIEQLAKFINSSGADFKATADTENNLLTFRLNSPLSVNSSISLTDSNGILGDTTSVRDPEKTVLNLSGSFNIEYGGEKISINVVNTDTLASICNKINSKAESNTVLKNANFKASIDRGCLTVTADVEDGKTLTVTSDSDTAMIEALGLVSSGETVSKEENFVLDSSSADIPYKLSFRVLDEDDVPSVLTVKIDRAEYINDDNSRVNGWTLRAELNGEPIYYDTDAKGNVVYHHTAGEKLTLEELKEFINGAASDGDVELEANISSNALVFTSTAENSLEVMDYTGMLGVITEIKQELTDVNMRVEPVELTDALNISGSFRIQIGTQGTRVTSEVFRENKAKNLAEGDILAQGTTGEKHTFRVGVAGDQVDFSATWNSSTGKWVLSSDLGMSASAGKTLTVKDLTDFMTKTFSNADRADNPALIGLSVTAGKSSTGTLTQFYIESRDNHLISISDVEGNLAERLGIVNKNPVITIDVESSDSLVTIRNKINEKYQAEFGLTEPEQWVHASVDNGYLEISANVAGEAQRITLMGSEDGNMQVLRRLGLTRNQQIISEVKNEDDENLVSFREVAYIPDTGIAQDASFTLNGVRYLSSDNKFNMARRIPALTGDTQGRYSASELSEVSQGMWLNLKDAGSAIITVRHHIQDGSIKALEEARDEMIPNLKSELDELAYGLIKHINALQYSGYGVASDITSTGVAFFDALGTRSGASEKLKVNDRVVKDPSLIGAAMGLKDSNGFALKGVSGGSGDGTNASRMNELNFSKVLEHGTMTISGIYDAMLAQIGTEAGHAKLMYTTQATVSEQINGQRQAVSGVNLDEELMDMVILNRAFGAMSRYITTMDEMLNTIINGMGLVGR